MQVFAVAGNPLLYFENSFNKVCVKKTETPSPSGSWMCIRQQHSGNRPSQTASMTWLVLFFQTSLFFQTKVNYLK